MGLKEMKSDLRSGLDYPDGGAWGGGPVQRPLMTKPLIDFSGNIGSAIDTVTDGFIRGGVATGIERRLTDVARIGKYLITPQGISFIAKQVGLQQSNPRMDGHTLSENKGAGGGGFIDGLKNMLVGSPANQRTYTPLTTLASIGTVGTGIYFDREGLIPGKHLGYIDADGRTIAGVETSNLFADSVEGNQTNRLLHFYENKILAPLNSSPALGGFGEELYSYGGGPDSFYGIGKTTIRRYTDTGGAINYKDHDLNGKTTVLNFLQTLAKPGFDYSKRTKDQNRTFNRESRIGLGNPGAKSIDGFRDNYINQTNEDGSLNYNVYAEGKVDKVNMMDIVDIKSGDFRGDGFRDMIRFRFEAIKQASPTQAEAMVFRAFLDDFSDNYSANHNEIKYNGRAENFYTYNSFKRDISLSFKIAAQSRHEMMPLYRKLNFLASNTAPEYSEGGRIMTPYIRLTVGSYLNRVPGVLKSIGIKWQKDYPWEISIDSPEGGMDSHMLVLPHVLDINVSFQPIHNFLPQKGTRNSPFILPHWDQRDGHLKPLQKWMNLTSDTKEKASRLGASKLHVPEEIPSKEPTKLPVEEPDMTPIQATAPPTTPPPPKASNSGAPTDSNEDAAEDRLRGVKQ